MNPNKKDIEKKIASLEATLIEKKTLVEKELRLIELACKQLISLKETLNNE